MDVNDIKTISVIGTGIMGLGAAVEFARFGYQVAIFDVSKEALESAMIRAREDLGIMTGAGLITAVEADAALGRLLPVEDLETAAEKSEYVLEAAPEVLSVKQGIFGRLDAVCPPGSILASTTSSLCASDIATETKHPERVIVTHYYSPPNFMPLVEVFPGPDTASGVVRTVLLLMRRLRKKAILFENERRRLLIGNRFQSAISREAQKLFDEGVSAEEIDATITFGFGRRMPFVGYFQRMDMVGLEGRMQRYAAMGHAPWAPITERVARGELGVKTGKGFHEWPGDSARRLNVRMKTDLAALMRQDLEEGLL